MSSKFGKDFRLNMYVPPDDPDPEEWHSLGGIPKPCRPQAISSEVTEAGTGQRALVTLDAAEIRYRMDVTLLLQRIELYLQTSAIITDEGIVPDHYLAYTDGIETKKLNGAKISRCEFRCRHADLIRTELRIVGKDIVDQDPPVPPLEWEVFPDKVLTYKNLTTVSIGAGDPITNWKEVAWGVDNHVVEESYGVDPKPTDIEELEADYFMEVVMSRKAASQLDLVGTLPAAQIVVTDNQTPTAKVATFDFVDCLVKTSRLEVPGLGALAERVELHPWKMTLTIP